MLKRVRIDRAGVFAIEIRLDDRACHSLEQRDEDERELTYKFLSFS